MSKHTSTSPMSEPIDPSMMAIFRNTMMRLQQTIDLETDQLRGNRYQDLSHFNELKSRSLLDLSRLSRHVKREHLNDENKEQLIILRQSLEENQRLLLAHLNAAREITTLISDAIIDSESDGTYGGPMVRKPGR